ncbi:Pentatricopeptide repeat-containing protein [Rhynchospora pubera]|uniref:Pentatricopeptide repeat-containing protein n=1 Tax=Rhynchospora pubera TaxID=906938 RepID=A0AAV8D4W1_9POAL|nr:Pentatricopeptide repeat-containing protein [Rhynchospora pubera]
MLRLLRSRHLSSILPNRTLLLSKRYSTTTPPQWTETVDYLDESGSVISTSPGARPVIPSQDSTILAGSVPLPVSHPIAAARLASLALRHPWGPDLLSRLDSLPSPPSLSVLLISISSLPSSDPTPSLSLFKWARRQTWCQPRLSEPLFNLVLQRLNGSEHSQHVLNLFDEMLSLGEKDQELLSNFSPSLNLAVQLLAGASLLEPSFACFKKLKDRGFTHFTTQTFNSMITLFLTKGLPYKAFEIYESMETSQCTLDSETYELMVPALAKSGRLDSALKLFGDMKLREDNKSRPCFGIYSSLVDCLGKAGRLDAATGLYKEMQNLGYKPTNATNASIIEALVKAGKLDAGMELWEEMKRVGFRPNFSLYTMMVEANAKSGKLDAAASLFNEMEKAGFFPTPATYACLIEMHSAAGQVEPAMRAYGSMLNAGVRPGLGTFTSLLTLLAKKKLVDLAAKILLEMKASGFPVEVNASDMLMVYIKDGSTELALKWLRFMDSAGIRTNNFIIRQLFESCMKTGMYESARPLLETYVGSAGKVDWILYTSILAHLVRCQLEANERAIMEILSITNHKAHKFLCDLFTGPEQRKKPVLTFVREFFQGIDYESEENAARYFVNVLLNYLVLMGQMNRARCVWKVAYESKLFPKAIVFDQHIAWSLDVRNLSVGAALVSVVHTLHRFRKRMLYYGVVPRRIKLVTGPTLKMVVAQVLESLESPFEVSKVVLRAPGDAVLEWFKKPVVQQFLLNEIPSKGDVLMHRLNVLFPSSAPEVRALSPPKPFSMGK